MVTDFTITLVNDEIAGKVLMSNQFTAGPGDYYPANLPSQSGPSLS
jgi:hypothetical protein